MNRLLKKSLLLAFILGFSNAYSQEDLIDTTEYKQKAHQFFAGTGYGSNLIYYGTSVSGNQPFFSGELLYSWEGGIWAGVGFFHLPEEQPFISFLDLSAGYTHIFNKVFDVGASISQYHGSQTLENTLYSDYTFLSGSLGIDWIVLYTSLSPGWLLAEENSFYFLVKNSHYIRTGNLGSKKSYLSFNPGLSLMFGSYAWMRQVRRIGAGSGPGFGNPVNPIQTEIREDFRLLDLQFSIPVAFNSRRLSLEFEPAYFLNLIEDANGETEGRFFFTLGIYYQLF
jgi:hypothetical protein